MPSFGRIYICQNIYIYIYVKTFIYINTFYCARIQLIDLLIFFLMNEKVQSPRTNFS